MPRRRGSWFGSGGDRKLPTTRWTMVSAAGCHEKAERDKALAELCELYWPPVYAYIFAQRRCEEEALDLTQGFFTTQLIEKYDIAAADPARGKFRNWLFKAVNNYIRNQIAMAKADKRIQNSRLISIDVSEVEGQCPIQVGHDVTPEFIFDQQWAMILLQQALLRLQASYLSRGEADLFERLIPLLMPGRKESHRSIAKELDMREGTFTQKLFRFRDHFRQFIRDEIAETVADKKDIEEELRHLYKCLESRPRPEQEVTDPKHFRKPRSTGKEQHQRAPTESEETVRLEPV